MVNGFAILLLILAGVLLIYAAIQGRTKAFGMVGRNYAVEARSEEDKKIYERELIRLELSLSAMSKIREEGDVVVGMTHYPPFGVTLASTRVTELFKEYGVEKVVYGHLHGNAYAKRKVFLDGATYFLTSCDLVDFSLVEVAD